MRVRAAAARFIEKCGFKLAEAPFDSEAANVERMIQYVPSSYPGKISIFAPEQSDYTGVSPTLDPRIAWRNLAIGGAVVHVIPGGHLSMLEEPNVGVLAEKLKASLYQDRESACIQGNHREQGEGVHGGAGVLRLTSQESGNLEAGSC